MPKELVTEQWEWEEIFEALQSYDCDKFAELDAWNSNVAGRFSNALGEAMAILEDEIIPNSFIRDMEM